MVGPEGSVARTESMFWVRNHQFKNINEAFLQGHNLAVFFDSLQMFYNGLHTTECVSLHSLEQMTNYLARFGIHYATMNINESGTYAWNHESGHQRAAQQRGIACAIVASLCDGIKPFICIEPSLADLENRGHSNPGVVSRLWGEILSAPYKEFTAPSEDPWERHIAERFLARSGLPRVATV